MNNKIAQIAASSILLLTTNILPSFAVNADAITSSTITSQVTDNNIKPLVERKNPKPQSTKGKPNPPKPPIERIIEPEPIPPQPQPQPRDCVKRVWHSKLKKWVYETVPCNKKQPSRFIN